MKNGTTHRHYSTYDAANAINEDLHQTIYNIDPVDTPILSMAADGKATNTLHEWLTDALDAPDGANAQIEGDDATGTAITAPDRLVNYAQISRKPASTVGPNWANGADAGPAAAVWTDAFISWPGRRA